MSSAGRFFAEYLLLRQRVSTYVNLASITLLGYEWALMIHLEVPLIWKSRPSLVKFLYIITRYMPFCDVSLVIYGQMVSGGLSAKHCAGVFSTFGWMFATGFSVAELILALRAWAVWGRGIKLGICLLAFYVAIFVAKYANLAIFINGIQYIHGIPGIPGCIVVGTSGNNGLYINYALLAVQDIVMCLLMIVKGRASYVSGGNTQLMNVVYKEGVIYYCCLVVLSLTNVILTTMLKGQILMTLMPNRDIILGGQALVTGTSTLAPPLETLRFIGIDDESKIEGVIERG